MENRKILIETQELTKEFNAVSSSWSKKKTVVHAVTDVSLKVYEGEPWVSSANPAAENPLWADLSSASLRPPEEGLSTRDRICAS